jgi:O-antigen/teichoic acid export membrane protein
MTDFFRRNAVLGAAELLCRIPLVFTAGYLARTVGTDAYGNWALILVFQGFVAAIAGLGMANAVSRFAPVSAPELARGYLLRSLGTAAIALALLAVFIWLATPAIAALIGISAQAEWLLPLTCMLAVAACIEGLLDAYFKATENIKRQVGFLLTRTGAEIAIVVAVLWLYASRVEAGAYVLLGIYTVAVVAVKVTGYSILVQTAGGNAARPAPEQWRSFVHYGLPLVPVVVISWLTMQGDRLILGHLVDKHWLGVYAFGASLAYYVALLGYAVYPLLLPRASRLHDDNQTAELQKLFAESQYVLLALLTAALAAIFLFAHEIVIYTAGPDFAASAPILAVLSIAVAIEQVFGIHQYAFHLAKKTHWVLWLNVCYAALIFTSVYAAARLGDVSWIPWAIVSATAAFNLVRYLISRRFIRLRMQAQVAWVLAAAIVTAFAIGSIAADAGIALRLALLAAVTCIAAFVLNSVMSGRVVLALRALVAR